jgi:hypothetical protein
MGLQILTRHKIAFSNKKVQVMPPRQTRQLKAPQCTQIGRDHLKKECNLGHLLSQKLEDIDLEKMEANQDFALLEIPVY